MRILLLNIGDEGAKGERTANLLRQHELLQPTVMHITLKINEARLPGEPQFIIPRISNINQYDAIVVAAHGILDDTHSCYREVDGPDKCVKLMDVKEFSELFKKIATTNGLDLDEKEIVLLMCYGARTNSPLHHLNQAKDINFNLSFAGRFARHLAKHFLDNEFHVTGYTGSVRMTDGEEKGEIAVQAEEQIELLRNLSRLQVRYQEINATMQRMELNNILLAKKELGHNHGLSSDEYANELFVRQMQKTNADDIYQQLSEQFNRLTVLISDAQFAGLLTAEGYGGVRFLCHDGHSRYARPKTRPLAAILSGVNHASIDAPLEPNVIESYVSLNKQILKELAEPPLYDQLTSSLAGSSELRVLQRDDDPDQVDENSKSPSTKR